MKCPNCGGSNFDVKDSRPYGANTVRRRKCNDCQNTFYTKEVIMDFNDGFEAIADFYRNYRSCSKRGKK